MIDCCLISSTEAEVDGGRSARLFPNARWLLSLQTPSLLRIFGGTVADPRGLGSAYTSELPCATLTSGVVFPDLLHGAPQTSPTASGESQQVACSFGTRFPSFPLDQLPVVSKTSASEPHSLAGVGVLPRPQHLPSIRPHAT